MAVNNYIPKYIPDDLPWYERNGLMTRLDKIKCDEFLEDPGKHLRGNLNLNFDMIYTSIRGEKIPEADLKNYHIVKYELVSKYPQKDKNNFRGAAFRNDRKDLYFDKEVVKSHFLNAKEKCSDSNKGNGSRISVSS